MKLNILGAKVTVKKIPHKRMEHRGEAKFDSGEIWISDELDDLEYQQVLYHEIMHWILYRNGMNEAMDKIMIEALCDTVGFVFSENLEIFKLTKK